MTSKHSNIFMTGDQLDNLSKESRGDWSRFREIGILEVRTVGSHQVTKFDQTLC